MKKKQNTIRMLIQSYLILALALLFLSLNGFAQGSEKKSGPAAAAQETPATVNRTQQGAPGVKTQPEPPAVKKAEQDVPAFKNRREMLSYAFGVELAKGLKTQRINPDVDLMVKALKDTLAGNELLMSETEATAALKTFEEDQKHDYEHARQMISEKNRKTGEAFVAENVKKDGVVTLPSGLQYKILKQGEGNKPTRDDLVECHYRGTLLDGTEFDSSYKHNQPTTLPVKKLIKGWAEALQLMPVGSKWRIFVPPHLAYGERVVGGIGPNAMLIFEVELLDIKPRPPDEDRAPKDQAASK